MLSLLVVGLVCTCCSIPLSQALQTLLCAWRIQGRWGGDLPAKGPCCSQPYIDISVFRFEGLGHWGALGLGLVLILALVLKAYKYLKLPGLGSPVLLICGA